MKNAAIYSILALTIGTHWATGCGANDDPIQPPTGSNETGGGASSTGGRGGSATGTTSSGGASTAGGGGGPGTGGVSGGGSGGGATGGAAGSGVATGGSGGIAGSGGRAGSTGKGGGAGTGNGGADGAGQGGQGGASAGGKAGASGSGGSAAGAAGTSIGGAAGNSGSAGAGGASTDAGGGSPQPLHFAVYGDTRTGSATHQQVIDQIAKLNPDLVIHSGDLWDGYTQAQFATILNKNSNIGALLANNLFVASRGNHETVADYLAFTPSLSRGNASEQFSYTVGNSFFVVLGMDPSGAATFLETELKKPEATAARWRFVQSHYPVYSGGTTHGASGIPSIEKLCDTYHVAVYWSGHDHIYERSQQVFGGQVVDTGDALSVSKGTVYIVSGGGGAPLYGVAKIATTHLQASTNNYVDAVADQTNLSVKAYKLDGSQLDSFNIAQ